MSDLDIASRKGRITHRIMSQTRFPNKDILLFIVFSLLRQLLSIIMRGRQGEADIEIAL